MQARTTGLLLFLFVAGLAVVLAVSLGGSDTGLPAAPGVDAAPAREAAPGAMLSADSGDAEQAAPGAGPGRQELTAASAPASARIALTGRLVRDGVPVSGVEVGFHASRFVGVDGVEMPVLGNASGRAGLEIERSGSDGKFRFMIAIDKPGRLTLPGDDHVFAGAGGDSMHVQAGRSDIDLGDVAVAAGAVLAGVVRDPTGRALEGVQIGLAVSTSARVLPAFSSRRMETDAEGRFRFAGLRGAEYRLTTASPQHLPNEKVVDLDTGGHREDIVLTLAYGEFIRGRVVDDLGRAVAGASVGAYRKRQVDESLTVRGLSHGESVETDAAGEFLLGGIDDDAVTVRAWADGYQPVSQGDVAKGSADLVLRLARNGSIEGRLVDGEGAGHRRQQGDCPARGARWPGAHARSLHHRRGRQLRAGERAAG